MRYEKLEVQKGAFVGESFRSSMAKKQADPEDSMAKPAENLLYFSSKPVPASFVGGEFLIGRRKRRRGATTTEALLIVEAMQQDFVAKNLMRVFAHAYEPQGKVARDLSTETRMAQKVLQKAKATLGERLRDLEGLAIGKTKESYQRQRQFLEKLGTVS